MKKIKFINLLFIPISFLIIVPSSVLFVTTSCSIDYRTDYTSEHADFINQRTFSLMCPVVDNPGYLSFGTGWLFKKSYDDGSPYSYYLATNVHVASLFSRSQAVPMSVSYNPNFRNSNFFIPQSKYWNLNNNYQLLGYDVTTRPTQPSWKDSNNNEVDVDFDVFKINFGTNDNISTNDPYKNGSSSPLLNRLNALNSYADNNNGNLLTFANSDYSYKADMNIHVAGFPMHAQNNSGGKLANWISYRTNIGDLYFGHTPQIPIIPVDPIDPIHFSDHNNIAIFGKCLSYKEKSTPQLTGGSSGSMITDDNDVVIGINFACQYSNNNEKSDLGLGLFLNTKSDFFGPNYQYEVFIDWYSNLP